MGLFIFLKPGIYFVLKVPSSNNFYDQNMQRKFLKASQYLYLVSHQFVYVYKMVAKVFTSFTSPL